MEVVCLFLNRVWNLGSVLKTHRVCLQKGGNTSYAKGY